MIASFSFLSTHILSVLENNPLSQGGLGSTTGGRLYGFGKCVVTYYLCPKIFLNSLVLTFLFITPSYSGVDQVVRVDMVIPSGKHVCILIIPSDIVLVFL